jgi:thioredoxin reductase (NADPH)
MVVRDVVVIGGGPSGLATAIAAQRAGLSYAVLEKGALVNTLFYFPTNMVYFTTPELLEIGGLPFVTPYAKPTRVEALIYYRRVVDTFQLEVRLGEEVTRVSEDADPSGERVLSIETLSERGIRRLLHGRTAVLATGAFDKPNLLGIPGEGLPHVSHYYREAHPYYRKRVVIVGGQNSAAEAALELYRAGVDVTLVHRRARLGDTIKYWVRPDIENRLKEGAVKFRFEACVLEIRPTTVLIDMRGEREELPADAVLLLTGYCSDVGLFERAGVKYHADSLAPVFDPQTFETSMPGLFVVGAAVTGRNSGKIFIENGRFHGQQVIKVIERRLRSADVVGAGAAQRN